MPVDENSNEDRRAQRTEGVSAGFMEHRGVDYGNNMPVLPKLPARARLATDAEQDAFMREAVIEQINRQPKMRVRPNALNPGGSLPILAWESEWNWVYDERRPWKISRQRVNFRDNGPPTVETILNRPLHGAKLIPMDCPYPVSYTHLTLPTKRIV